MKNRAEVREFLTSRRSRLSPEEVGLPVGENRWVAGLRRGEVAVLAGVKAYHHPEAGPIEVAFDVFEMPG